MSDLFATDNEAATDDGLYQLCTVCGATADEAPLACREPGDTWCLADLLSTLEEGEAIDRLDEEPDPFEYEIPAEPPVSVAEDDNKARLRDLLTPSFDVYPEAWVREPMRGTKGRLDFVIIPHDNVFDAGLPFDVIGVEVKRSPLTGRVRRHAFGQCISYRNCVLIDKRLAAARGLAIPAVALYAAGDSYRGGYVTRDADAEHLYGEVRLAGTQNVGLFVHHRYDNLTLEISGEAIWCERRGVTGVGANWPRARRFANGTNRKA